MEDELDGIADGRIGRTDWLTAFYFGGDVGPEGSVGRTGGLKKLVGERLEDIDAREVNSLPLLTDSRGPSGAGPGRPVRAVPGAGRRLGEDGTRAVAAGQPARGPAAGRGDGARSPRSCSARPADGGENELGVDPDTGNVIVARDGRYGPYVTEVLPDPGRARGGRTGPEEDGQGREAADRVAVQVHVAGHRRPAHRAEAALAAQGGRRRPGRRRRDHRAERPVRAVPEEGHRLPVADRARRRCSPSPWTRRWRCTPSPRPAAGRPPPHRRCARSAPTRPAASRW